MHLCNLKVDEHLKFFANLKGVSDWSVTGQRVLTDLGMANVINFYRKKQLHYFACCPAIDFTPFKSEMILLKAGNVRSSALSGGMKRKLCMAIAMAGEFSALVCKYLFPFSS